ncbi:hypothetical protein CRM22_006431 [Opisthorchis felineus]|uniref:Uncharacterized protein n=1 Tax=Opisthorchis felineus TaxID=147828 RepID=A0A4S2LTN5_OPIFE|nr:hypothetical protein CRM22_006431 [Opisthorchis felineus]
MPQNATVILRYGMYEVAGVVTPRTHRLQGLKCQLEKNGHNVVLEEIPGIRGILEVMVNGEKVYGCQVLDLQFSCDGLLDERCSEIVQAVLKAY